MSEQQDRKENVGLAPLPSRPPGATLMPGGTYRNTGTGPLYVINPATFQDWLNRNYGQRILALRQRIQAIPASGPRPVIYAQPAVYQQPAWQVDSDLDDSYFDDGGYDDDWDGMSGIQGLNPEDPQNVGATQVPPPKRKSIGHLLPPRPGAVGPMPPRHPGAVGPFAPRHPAAIGPIRPRSPQQEIAQLKQALANCQHHAAQHPHPMVRQLHAIKAQNYQHLIEEMEHALLAAGITIAEDNNTLLQDMMSCSTYDGVSGQDGQAQPQNGPPQQGDDLGRFHGAYHGAYHGGHHGRVSGPDGDVGRGGGGHGGGGHGGGGHGGHGGHGFGGRGGWGGGGWWGWDGPGYIDDTMNVYDDPYAGYPGMMGVQQPPAGPGANYPVGSPPPPPSVPGTPPPSAANLGCASGSCGSPTAAAPPSLGTFMLPGFSGPMDGTSGYGPS